jgi:hypothetical protein
VAVLDADMEWRLAKRLVCPQANQQHSAAVVLTAGHASSTALDLCGTMIRKYCTDVILRP